MLINKKMSSIDEITKENIKNLTAKEGLSWNISKAFIEKIFSKIKEGNRKNSVEQASISQGPEVLSNTKRETTAMQATTSQAKPKTASKRKSHLMEKSRTRQEETEDSKRVLTEPESVITVYPESQTEPESVDLDSEPESVVDPENDLKLEALRSLFNPPRITKRLNMVAELPEHPTFTPHPVSLGVDYNRARAAFYFHMKNRKLKHKRSKLSPLQSIDLTVPFFPNNVSPHTSVCQSPLQQDPKVSSSNIPMSPASQN